MGFNPNTNVKDIAVLVIDKNNPHLGKLGKLTAHDWREYGNYFVQFSNGKEETFPDGLCKGDPKSPVRTFYRHKNEMGEGFDEEGCGPKGLLQTYLSLNIGTILDFNETYRHLFNDDF